MGGSSSGGTSYLKDPSASSPFSATPGLYAQHLHAVQSAHGQKQWSDCLLTDTQVRCGQKQWGDCMLTDTQVRW